MTVEPTSDKWQRRRSARRATPAPIADPGPEGPAVLYRPVSLDRAFVLWMVIGVLTALVLVGIVIIAAAFNLRAGYRGARVLLTVFALPSFFAPLGALAAVVEGQVPVLGALLFLIPSAVVITASALMWRLEVNEYFHAMRTRPEG